MLSAVDSCFFFHTTFQTNLPKTRTMTQSIWGKIGGAGVGYAFGGPIGALLGAFAGHFLFDSSSALLAPPPRDVVFTTGLIALAAKMAKADGVVLQVEVDAFNAIIDIPPAEKDKVQKFFRTAQSTTDGFEAYAKQLAEAFAEEPTLLEDILDGLFHIAKADGAVHEAELGYLHTVADLLGFNEAAFLRIASRHVVLAENPYAILGVNRDMPDNELKRIYRKLVTENHPDSRIARGLPQEAVRLATERLATINTAWDRIASERNIR